MPSTNLLQNHTPTYSLLGKRPAPVSEPRTRAKRRKGLNAMTDLEVWDCPDEEILGQYTPNPIRSITLIKCPCVAAVRETWRSPVYNHYDVHLERHFSAQGEPSFLLLRFECVYHLVDHIPQHRERLRSSDGTQNLLVSARGCDRRRGRLVKYPVEHTELSEYSEAKHRAILAIRCAHNHRSFESVVDDLHRKEVELLRPGTVLPSAVTVSKDVKNIYEDASSSVKTYLQVRDFCLNAKYVFVWY